MADSKRGPGRPKGSRNKVNIRQDVIRALKTGMSLTELKEFIEEYLSKVAEDGDHKNVVALIKQDIELMRYLHKMEIDFDSEDQEDDENADDDQGESGKVFNFKRN